MVVSKHCPQVNEVEAAVQELKARWGESLHGRAFRSVLASDGYHLLHAWSMTIYFWCMCIYVRLLFVSSALEQRS
jgi:hypothetical protein